MHHNSTTKTRLVHNWLMSVLAKVLIQGANFLPGRSGTGPGIIDVPARCSMEHLIDSWVRRGVRFHTQVQHIPLGVFCNPLQVPIIVTLEILHCCLLWEMMASLFQRAGIMAMAVRGFLLPFFEISHIGHEDRSAIGITTPEVAGRPLLPVPSRKRPMRLIAAGSTFSQQ